LEVLKEALDVTPALTADLQVLEALRLIIGKIPSLTQKIIPVQWR